MEAKDLCFWFLIDRMKPLTVTLSRSATGVSRRCATDSGAAAYAREDEWNARLRCVARRGWTILMRVLEMISRELIEGGRLDKADGGKTPAANNSRLAYVGPPASHSLLVGTRKGVRSVSA